MSRRKPIKEFPTAQGKQRLRRANCVTHRNGRLEVRRPREINVSEGKDLLLFTGDPFVSYSDTRRRNIGYFPTNSTTNFITIFLRIKLMFLIYNIT